MRIPRIQSIRKGKEYHFLFSVYRRFFFWGGEYAIGLLMGVEMRMLTREGTSVGLGKRHFRTGINRICRLWDV